MKKRSGFTLVELLVVIAIIGILVALLLPAVQMAREAARRMQCTNNLKQLGIAAHNYHDTHGAFPGLYVYLGESQDNNPAWGWGMSLMPYMEKENIVESLDSNKRTLVSVCNSNNPSTKDYEIMSTFLSDFACPSDAGDELNATRNFPSTGVLSKTDHPLARANYVASQGMQFCQSRYGEDFWSSDPAAPKPRGMFYGNSFLKMASVTDGTSNTFLFGERTSENEAGYWIGVGRVRQDQAWGTPKIAGRTHVLLNPVPGSTNHYKGFSSLHPGGANFCFADGSVHFISETIDYGLGGWTWRTGIQDENTLGTYQKLSVRNDGLPIGEF